MTNDGALVHHTIDFRSHFLLAVTLADLSGTKSEPCASASKVDLPDQVEELLK